MFRLLSLANHELLMGNSDLSLLKLAHAAQIYERVENHKALSTTLFNLGNIHFLKERYEEAIENYIDSIFYLKKFVK